MAKVKYRVREYTPTANQGGTRNERSKTKRSKPVQQLDADGNVVAEYPSTIEAERVTGTNRYQIRMCCNGKYKTAGGYRWKFKEQ